MADARGPVPQVIETPPPELKVDTDAEFAAQQDAALTNGVKNIPAPPVNGKVDVRSASPAQHSNPLLSPTPPTQTSRDTSPDGLSAHATGQKPHSALKKTGPPTSILARHRQADQSPLSLTRQSTEVDSAVNANGTPTATRKGVQFSTDPEDNVPHDTDGEEERPDGSKPHSLYAKLRAIATSQGFVHTRSASGWSLGGKSTDSELTSTTPSRMEGAALSATVEESDSDAADADAEESAADSNNEQGAPRKRKRKTRRLDNIETAPASPHSPMHSGFPSAPQQTDADPSQLLTRRATDTDMSRDRSGISEDEGRKRLNPSSAWKPKHPLRGLSYGNQRKTSEGTPEPRENRRPLTLRTLTNITSGHSNHSAQEGDNANPDTPRASRRKMLTERGTTLGAAKWRQLKQKLNMLGAPRKPKERTQDQEKSAELLAELAAGSPAALILASMFQRDEHGQRRIPVLLEQLKVQITDSRVDRYKDPDISTPGDRHLIFRIEMEYGNGINRMKWVINRSLKDFVTLHAKYKLHYSSEKLKGRGDSGKQMPRFPKSAFPYLKGYGVKAFEDEEEPPETEEVEERRPETDTERPRPKPLTPFALGRRRSSLGNRDDAVNTPQGRDDRQAEKQRERQRKKLELYLQQMIKFMLFRADSNRLCKFLEISALGMRLASEGSYHGKEGYLVIRSGKGVDFRKAFTPTDFKLRHTPKWWLVRHSYVVCVDSPEEMHIYDVFLFDSDFRIQSSKDRSGDKTKAKELAEAAKESAKHPRNHRLKLYNSERKLKLLARNERMLHQFEESIQQMITTSPWTDANRFDSFAPVRQKCFAQWLVDGRDHMWVVSRALNQAKDVIYIHDWWLSPELYMRRPPAISQKWRLDRILKRKAEEGVKVFVIVYRNIESAIPIDSQYTKFSLLDLHPNIFVQRSPNQFRQNTFFWAHHEKICIVDHTLAFVGGIDLCLGRWDTPQHTLTDDKPTGFELAEEPKDADHCQLWPGKDYSNPRIQDFYALNKPYEEMYNRSKIARMPWHDISMQVVGQPARDLTRHFVQRWNYILRQRKPTRPTPFLLPPPDFNPADLEALGLDGTCEVQILRSAGPWSLGTPDKTEHSIMNAYIKLIEESEHFVYIENQFFISSCETDGATVHNKISDALVERITRASKNDQPWRAIIVIPLIPGFQNTVEEEGGTSVRLIMQYQYRSICRGDSSIFGRLRSNGIDPEDYIQFYSLRQWGRIGPKNALVTEQLYIHAKCMVVDDRIAIIGSANINERSMLGNRDSECASVVRDTDMLWSTMNGQPYQVGRFPHSMRMRLMREHLGLDVDKIMEDAQAMENEHRKPEGGPPAPVRPGSPNDEEDDDFRSPESPAVSPVAERQKEFREELFSRQEELHSFNHDIDWEQAGNPNLKANRKLTEDHRVTGTAHHKQDVDGDGYDNMAEIEDAGYGSGRDTAVVKGDKEVLVKDHDPEGRKTLDVPRQHDDIVRLPSYVAKREVPNPPMPPKPTLNRFHSEQLGLPMLSSLPPLPVEDDTDIGGPPLERTPTKGSGQSRHPLLNELRHPLVDRDCMTDPIADPFIEDIWHTVAENNTKIYRSVFRCMPDNQVRDWHEYHQYVAYEQRFNQLQGNDITENVQSQHLPAERRNSTARTGPPGAGASVPGPQLKALTKMPLEVAKGGNEMREKIMGMIGVEGDKEAAEKEKERLRQWAEDTNRQQSEKQGRPLHRQGTILDEKETLKGIPEDEAVRQTTPNSAKNSGSEGNSSPTTATSGTKVDAVDGMNEKGEASGTATEGGGRARAVSVAASTATASGTVKRRRRGTTRSSRRDFSASDDILSIEEAEELLEHVQGRLVSWPYDW